MSNPDQRPPTDIRRFTISRHTGAGSTHYDFMIEEGESLKTWKIATLDFSLPQSAEQNADHRKIYLDYAGDISGERGRVAIADTGTCEIERRTERQLTAFFHGGKLTGRLSLTLDDPAPGRGARWTITP
ncbi:MAG: hypothetical protein A2Z34_10325 [Planctomycetes bacterium RBG_16_59_8]|nr:MAG: hypothetical protein A2Z34_10325 [Planctomycetes bacterium RBG_16_59_8]